MAHLKEIQRMRFQVLRETVSVNLTPSENKVGQNVGLPEDVEVNYIVQIKALNKHPRVAGDAEVLPKCHHNAAAEPLQRSSISLSFTSLLSFTLLLTSISLEAETTWPSIMPAKTGKLKTPRRKKAIKRFRWT